MTAMEDTVFQLVANFKASQQRTQLMFSELMTAIGQKTSTAPNNMVQEQDTAANDDIFGVLNDCEAEEAKKDSVEEEHEPEGVEDISRFGSIQVNAKEVNDKEDAEAGAKEASKEKVVPPENDKDSSPGAETNENGNAEVLDGSLVDNTPPPAAVDRRGRTLGTRTMEQDVDTTGPYKIQSTPEA